MPLPMVHMSITADIFKQRGTEIDPKFLLGSISPDAIHMRENTNRADKIRTHFDFNEDYTVEDFFNKMRPFVDLFPADPQWIMFARGYISHVLTDLIWSHTVYSDFQRKIANEQIENVRTLYYMETDQIDFNLFRLEPWRPQAWESLENCPSISVDDILTEEEVEKWKHRTLDWYTDTSKEPCIEPKYITEDSVRSFIKDTSRRLTRLFEGTGYK
ncbi:zinc dependent phospholipase C family protein [Paenibacillus sp. GP183]|jgi:hypothetical protein|uniref:zinc dependent phospholipase C family protein n=1 Tax=Paenibacillus sp. GP183 TaxID=1882751 RepID=UPI00089D193E|nr:zinc dependent phospholipase C family protein [Paenibacillus sp. GP183]SED08649.1 Zinc dependent phospholipase C [Paenibacillus sp. GP183]